jgi:SAM-dependent methyltransferase
MMQANKLVSYNKIDATLPFITLVDIFEKIFIYSFTLPLEEVQKKLISYPCMRYLDNFLVISPRSDTMEYGIFWKLFFEYFAPEYEKIIDIKNNQENIIFLFDVLKKITYLSSDSLVLDFACGTGLSAGIVKGIKLFGVDASKNMCKIANDKGLRTIDMETLSCQSYCYDAIFSSYAMHICYDTSTLSIIWNSLKSGKPLVANFHKNIGIDHVNKFIHQEKGEILEIKNNVNTKHGKYYAYIKK